MRKPRPRPRRRRGARASDCGRWGEPCRTRCPASGRARANGRAVSYVRSPCRCGARPERRHSDPPCGPRRLLPTLSGFAERRRFSEVTPSTRRAVFGAQRRDESDEQGIGSGGRGVDGAHPHARSRHRSARSARFRCRPGESDGRGHAARVASTLRAAHGISNRGSRAREHRAYRELPSEPSRMTRGRCRARAELVCVGRLTACRGSSAADGLGIAAATRAEGPHARPFPLDYQATRRTFGNASAP